MTGCNLSQDEQDWLEGGIAEFNNSRYWHAHEDWEELWKSLKPDASQELIDGVQGMIQIAAMLLNHQRRKARGVTNLWTKASAKLEPVKEGLFGIDIENLTVDCEPFHRDVETFTLDALTVRIQRQS